MRVLFVNHAGEMGGAEHSLLALVRGLPVEAHVVLFAPGPFEQQLRAAGISVERLGGAERLVSLGAETALATRLRGLVALPVLLTRLARRARASDLIYVNTKKAVLIAALASRVAGRPLIWHQRDVMRVPASLPWRARISERLLVGLLNVAACRIISVSRACAEAFVDAGGRSRLPVVIHNGLDTDPFSRSVDVAAIRQACGLPGDGPLLGCFGRITAGKGQNDLIDALTEIPNAHVVLVGAPIFGERGAEQRLRDQVERLGLSRRVHFLGHRSDVPALMALMDVVVHPSSDFDACPRVVLEALHAGKPVVATRVGGAPELIEHGVTGLLAPPHAPSALAAAIRRLLASPDVASRLARAGRERARDHFTLERVLREVSREIEACGRRMS